VQYIEHIFQHVILFKFIVVIGALAKANVLFVRLVKITRLFNLSFSGARESLCLFELKKCAVGKIKNTEA
jgi:hypothetical protein